MPKDNWFETTSWWSDHNHWDRTLIGGLIGLFKGIVSLSRDVRGLQKNLMDRKEVFIISASCIFLSSSAFSYRILKNDRISDASF